MNEYSIFIEIFAAQSILMMAAWSWQWFVKRAEIVDICWTLGVGGAGIWCALQGEGLVERRVILSSIVALWSSRLALHLINDRLFAKSEDGRYHDLRKSWGDAAQIRFFIFFQLQAFLVAFLAITFFVVAKNSSPIGVLDLIAIGVFVCSLIGEAVADRQLAQFKETDANRGKICDKGLWGYSRHPNYFFEWMHWIVYPLLAFGSSLFLLSLVAPLVMYYLIRYVTGVPATETRMRASRGETFLIYERRVSEFWPRPPKG